MTKRTIVKEGHRKGCAARQRRSYNRDEDVDDVGEDERRMNV